MVGTAVDSIKKWLPRLADALFPRRCPFCGALLSADALQGTVCPACVPEEMRLQHIPPRLPEGEHSFYALSQAAAAYYYADAVRSAILRCKRGGSPWRARELADRMAVLVFGALPARRVGGLPLLLARRLGQVLRIPVETPLSVRPGTRPQKELTRDERLQNARGAFVCQPGADLTGKRVLLVDDIITTGATASACALALLQAGATDVTVAAVAVAEELPKEKRKKTK